ncbi:MAG: hypothetical protein AABM66_06335 [Actinomycetota bacterium]
MIAAAGGLALTAAPQALADPVRLGPSDGARFTARVGQIAFRASVNASTPPAFPGQMYFRVSRSNPLSNPITLTADPDTSFFPPVYRTGPDSDANWPNRPDTYYWQARYDDCTLADPSCFSEIRSLTIDPLPPPTHRLPADDETIPYGEEAMFSLEDVHSYERNGTRIEIEFSTGTARSSDGTFADPELIARPTLVAGGLYRYRLTDRITQTPGTYYWIVERFDCAAEGPDDCYVTDGEVRSFTVTPPAEGDAPNTTLRHHPPRRTRKRRVRFAFSSSIPDSSFQCFYTAGWSECQSPQKFRRLKPGRYRFKVRAVTNGKRDQTPAAWRFRVLRRR